MAKKKELIDEFLDTLSVIIVIYVIYLLLLWFTNREEFLKLLLVGLAFFAVILLILFYRKKLIIAKKEKLIEDVINLGLNDDINNFINRSGKEKGKGVWQYMDYGFNIDRMRIFIKTLTEKGLKNKQIDDLKYIIKRFIDDKEEILLKGSLNSKQYNFSSLGGNDFELLLIKLYEAMGYLVQHLGGNGDQGADLIIVKNEQRILIQAKCYKTWGIGNAAVQQATAAKTHYDCNKAMVIGIPYFTKEAQQLAKTNGVDLVGKKELQTLLLSYLKESWI
ncbi:MAG: restriction endonuclease [Candidatus Paceibacterota bacterium]